MVHLGLRAGDPGQGARMLGLTSRIVGPYCLPHVRHHSGLEGHVSGKGASLRAQTAYPLVGRQTSNHAITTSGCFRVLGAPDLVLGIREGFREKVIIKL